MWGDSPPDECQGQDRAAPSVTQPRILSITWLLFQRGDHEDPHVEILCGQLAFRILYFQSKKGVLSERFVFFV